MSSPTPHEQVSERAATEQRERRILLLDSERGWRGGQHQLLLLAKGLATSHRPLVVVPPHAVLAGRSRAEGLETRELRMRGVSLIAAISALRTLIRTQHIALVHAHTSRAHSLAAMACMGTDVPVIVTRRVDFPLKRGVIAEWKYGGAVARHAAVSERVRQVLVAGGVSRERIEVIRDGIDFGRFPPAVSALRAEWSLPTDAMLVGVVAHLADHKDHRTLLSGWQSVEQRVAHAWLLIVGTGELDSELKALAQRLRLRRVIFTGFRDDINDVLRGLDVFTLTSHLEGLGSSVMDAMYCGLPIVATRAGGIPELIDDQHDGLLVAVRDPTGLATALVRVIHDVALRQRLGAAARQRAEAHFSADAMIARYRALYDRVLGVEHT
jgi:glycosyltransferase involved in cell wall biosynthesis